MHVNLRNLWVGVAFQQVRSFRRMVTVVPKSVEAGWPLGQQIRCDPGLPRRDELLNPLEFHGKRPSEWSARPPASQRRR